MEKDFEEKIIKSIKSSGIPLQIYVSMILEKNDWHVRRGSLYESEKESDLPFEIDVIGEKEFSSIKKYRQSLIIECKKQENHSWIFFKKKGVLNDNLVYNLATKDEGEDYQWILHNWNKLPYKNLNLHSYYMAFPFIDKKRKERGICPIDKAIRQVLRSSFFSLNQLANFIQGTPKGGYFVYSIIVLEGKLISAEVKDDKVKLNDANHIQLHIDYELEKGREIWNSASTGIIMKTKKIIIDVVKKEYLEEFLKRFEIYKETE